MTAKKLATQRLVVGCHAVLGDQPRNAVVGEAFQRGTQSCRIAFPAHRAQRTDVGMVIGRAGAADNRTQAPAFSADDVSRVVIDADEIQMCRRCLYRPSSGSDKKKEG